MMLHPSSDLSLWRGACGLPHRELLQAHGPDAATFLHGQLSQDVTGMGAGQARLAAFCSAKGRMLSDALLLRPEAETVWMLMEADLAPAVLRRLSMFVMRAKLTLTSLEPDWAVAGLLGDDVPTALSTLPAWSAVPAEVPSGAWCVSLPETQGVRRALWVGPRSAAPGATSTPAESAQALSRWKWLDVMSGLARIEAVNTDQFVPQMVNFEVVGGVNFRKGCYPGQEVVARSQYRGSIKRRLFLVHGHQPLSAGDEVWSADEPGQPAGRVVNAAPMPDADGVWTALVELKLAAEHTPLHAALAEGGWGEPLQRDTLPYELISPTA